MKKKASVRQNYLKTLIDLTPKGFNRKVLDLCFRNYSTTDVWFSYKVNQGSLTKSGCVASIKLLIGNNTAVILGCLFLAQEYY